VFNRTTLVASGIPVAGDQALRGVAVTDDGRYAGVGGGWFTLHDLSANNPIAPIYTDKTPSQVRAVAFSANGRYVAYGGYNNDQAKAGASPASYLAVYDVLRRELMFRRWIEYPRSSLSAELRHLSISSDGNRIVAGNWAHHLLYFVRTDPSSTTWELKQDLEFGERLYDVAIDPSDSVVVVGEQSGLVQLYAMDDTSLTRLWETREGIDGGPRTVGISSDGNYMWATTRGGCGADRGGQLLVWSRAGEPVFSGRTAGANCTNNVTGAESWFGAVSASGLQLAFGGWGGKAYFYRLASP
jgi:WD40 repeat protein